MWMCDVIDRFHPQFKRPVASRPRQPQAPVRGLRRGPSLAQPNPFSKLVSSCPGPRARVLSVVPNNSLAPILSAVVIARRELAGERRRTQAWVGSAAAGARAELAMLGRAARGGPSSTTTKPPPHAEGGATTVVADAGQEVTVSQFVAQLGS